MAGSSIPLGAVCSIQLPSSTSQLGVTQAWQVEAHQTKLPACRCHHPPDGVSQTEKLVGVTVDVHGLFAQSGCHDAHAWRLVLSRRGGNSPPDLERRGISSRSFHTSWTFRATWSMSRRVAGCSRRRLSRPGTLCSRHSRPSNCRELYFLFLLAAEGRWETVDGGV